MRLVSTLNPFYRSHAQQIQLLASAAKMRFMFRFAFFHLQLHVFCKPKNLGLCNHALPLWVRSGHDNSDSGMNHQLGSIFNFTKIMVMERNGGTYTQVDFWM